MIKKKNIDWNLKTPCHSFKITFTRRKLYQIVRNVRDYQ